nr:YfhO family protein [Secundilactobacillus kimchicus]
MAGCLILLPLVMLGVQRFVTYKRADLYVITLWLTLVTNYYLGYMTCLFVVLYFGYLLVATVNRKKAGAGLSVATYDKLATSY